MVLVKFSKLVEGQWKWIGTFKSREDLLDYKNKHHPDATILIEQFEVESSKK